MIWAGIAAGGFCPGELVADRCAAAALAGEAASAAAANARTSFNGTVMGGSLGRGRQRCLVVRKGNYVQNGHGNCRCQSALQAIGSANWRCSQARVSHGKISCAREASTNNLG